ncbi:hypothetical protein [Ensifer soli]|uniref:hypothetical protein n=1 Tax=Ciceribacter sp. sgz301302 TaxID=3342379 RepID=UPI0035BB1DEA
MRNLEDVLNRTKDIVAQSRAFRERQRQFRLDVQRIIDPPVTKTGQFYFVFDRPEEPVRH